MSDADIVDWLEQKAAELIEGPYFLEGVQVQKAATEITSLRTELAALRERASEARGLLDEFFRIYPGGTSPLHEDFDSRVDDYLAKTRPIPTDTKENSK